MQLYIYNTLTRKKEEFVPLMQDPNYKGPKKDFVGLYSCGPTVYRDPSIGNYRATFTADLIRNTLKLLGYNVKAVMNITDVGHLTSDADEGEDKLEKGAKREGISAWEVAQKYENIFKEGMKALNIDEFDVMPRATEHIQQQIDLVKTLEEKGYTYVVEGDGIYMDTSKVENYGELMGPNYKKRLADLNAGERVEMGGKKHPTDFALRKFSPVNEHRQMERDSPWGKGFPGRHIECSAMSSEYLGHQFDIHHGGADHITIHHPNEIAQSECGFDVHPRVKYRVHNEFLQVDGGKMSKSLGNVYNLKDIESKGFSPLDLRYFYFMAQYGNFQNFTWDALKAAKISRINLSIKLSKVKEKVINANIQDQSSIYEKVTNFFNIHEYEKIKKDNYTSNFREVIKTFFGNEITQSFEDLLYNLTEDLLDNMNTPKIISRFHFTKFDDNKENGYIYALLKFFDDKLLKLGLFDMEFIPEYSNEKIDIPAEVTSLADQRIEAKKNKDYALADELRNKIAELGFQVKDTKDRYEITKI